MKSGQHLKSGLNVKFGNFRLQGCLSDRAQIYDTCFPPFIFKPWQYILQPCWWRGRWNIILWMVRLCSNHPRIIWEWSEQSSKNNRLLTRLSWATCPASLRAQHTSKLLKRRRTQQTVSFQKVGAGKSLGGKLFPAHFLLLETSPTPFPESDFWSKSGNCTKYVKQCPTGTRTRHATQYFCRYSTRPDSVLKIIR